MGIKTENEQLHQEKKYQFMKVQLRPDRKKQVTAVCWKLGILAVSAVIFGGMAGAAFMTVKQQLEKTSAGAGHTVAVTPAPTVVPTPAPSAAGDGLSGRRLTLRDYNRLSEELAAVGDTLEHSMVGVRSKGDNSTLWRGYAEANRLLFGLIFQETKEHYYILTACDTIREQTGVKVRMMDNSVVDGRIVGSDYSLNLAVVSVQKELLSDDLIKQVSVYHLSGEAQVVNGSKVIAVGCPSGVIDSVMTGSVSHDEIAVSVLDNELRVFSTDMLYSDQSNGVVLNQRGKVIGVITREFPEYTGKSGMAFVDIASLQDTISFLRQGKRVPYMGIVTRTLEASVAKAHHLTQGVYVTDVYSKSPAYQAGMRVADVIVQVDGEEVKSMEEIYRRLVAHNKKETMVCQIIRIAGKKKVRKNIKIKLG